MTMMIKNKHGVETNCTQIADLWHIAMALPEPQQTLVLDVWTQAHAMHDELHRQRNQLRADVDISKRSSLDEFI